ncbi:MAG: efflux RND transporter permease subunit [Nitrospinota bacterium]|nr:efflux RND transporter permease subunit [Nitrospinota bacterium]
MTQPLPATAQKGRSGGLASWSISHPIGVSMIALAFAVIGLFNFYALSVDLLPHIIYPNIRVRISDPGVAAKIMEDDITRQLEEQLAITEDAISVLSRTSEGNSSVDLSFEYGKDIDIALRDASTRLDRAKRFFPDTILPPTIYKLDPSQIPVYELVVASETRDPVALRDWIDYVFSKWFLNLPGVAAVEVGGGREREIQVLPDRYRLEQLGLEVSSISDMLAEANVESAGGRIETAMREYISRTAGRFSSLEELAQFPIPLPAGGTVHLSEVAEIIDGHKDERIRVRLNSKPGVKVAIQKQPTSNTVLVADNVEERLAWLNSQRLIPEDITIQKVSDQSLYIRDALSNASSAVTGGALLAMIVVWLFLGDLRRTLIIGTAIPLAVLVTFSLMGMAGLTLNIMTLGGLALGVGMVVDGAIVIMENIFRHQREGLVGPVAGKEAAGEVNSAIVASTSTSLAAVVPFLFISGLVGLMFRELIITVISSLIASVVVALTLTPALAVHVSSIKSGRVRLFTDKYLHIAQTYYAGFLSNLLEHKRRQNIILGTLILLLALSLYFLLGGRQLFLPSLDDGRIQINISADAGIPLEDMNATVTRLEKLFSTEPEVMSVFSTIGGSIFGRSQRETANRSSISIELVPLTKRNLSSEEWIRGIQKKIDEMGMAGIKVHMRSGNIRGMRMGGGDDDVTLRIVGMDISRMEALAEEVVQRLKKSAVLRNVTHSSEEKREELAIDIDRERLAEYGLTVKRLAREMRLALDGETPTDFIDGDRKIEIRIRLPRSNADTVGELESLPIGKSADGRDTIYLSDVAKVSLASTPAEILRDNQRRVVEVTASINADISISEATEDVWQRLADLPLPDGYGIYDAGMVETMQEGSSTVHWLLGLALFLVLVVMAVQYESMRNPFIILLAVPFTLPGVAIALGVISMPISMPVWLGLIMLAGIVVNNAIVLIEFVEILRGEGMEKRQAIIEAGRVRLRPILMTTMTTVCGLLPLGIGLGQGAELLRPLAVTIIGGLTFSMLITLVLIPIYYNMLGKTAQ